MKGGRGEGEKGINCAYNFKKLIDKSKIRKLGSIALRNIFNRISLAIMAIVFLLLPLLLVLILFRYILLFGQTNIFVISIINLILIGFLFLKI